MGLPLLLITNHTMDVKTPKSRVALVDDHVLLRKGLEDYIRSFDDYEVMLEASDGRDFIRQLGSDHIPDIVLLDISMPAMDGFETAYWITTHYPGIKILALSVSDREQSIIRMIRNGANGYVVKDIEPLEFKCALDQLVRKGYYYSGQVKGSLIHALQAPHEHKEGGPVSTFLNERELCFLRLACSELTYKEIADRMCLSARTIDGYRDALFEKLHVKTRVGLVMYAIRNGIVKA